MNEIKEDEYELTQQYLSLRTALQSLDKAGLDMLTDDELADIATNCTTIDNSHLVAYNLFMTKQDTTIALCNELLYYMNKRFKQ